MANQSSAIRKAPELEDGEVAVCRRLRGNDLDTIDNQYQVSHSQLRRRMRELGLEPKKRLPFKRCGHRVGGSHF